MTTALVAGTNEPPGRFGEVLALLPSSDGGPHETERKKTLLSTKVALCLPKTMDHKKSLIATTKKHVLYDAVIRFTENNTVALVRRQKQTNVNGETYLCMPFKPAFALHISDVIGLYFDPSMYKVTLAGGAITDAKTFAYLLSRCHSLEQVTLDTFDPKVIQTQAARH